MVIATQTPMAIRHRAMMGAFRLPIEQKQLVVLDTAIVSHILLHCFSVAIKPDAMAASEMAPLSSTQ